VRFKRHVQWERGLGPIDIAPFVDIVFQLLIFFMLTSLFVFQSGIKVKLPKTITSEVIQEDNLVVTITSEDVMYLGGTVITLKELHTQLSKPANRNRPILIKSDRRSSLGRIIDVWDLCRDLNIEKVNIATNQEK